MNRKESDLNSELNIGAKPVALVVDDDVGNLELLRQILGDDYFVETATRGERALTLARIAPGPDVILLDLVMPDIDGIETCRRLKQDKATADIPVIFLTVSPAPDDEERALSVGAADFIVKPVHPPVLLARLRNQLQVKRARDAMLQENARLDERIRNNFDDLLATQNRLELLIHAGLDLGREFNRIALLRKILTIGTNLLNCDAGTIYLVTERRTLSFAVRTLDDELPSIEIPLYHENGEPDERFMSTWCALHNRPVVVDDVYKETHFDVSGARRMDAATGYRSVSALSVPLAAHDNEVIGVLQFINAIDPDTGAIIPFPRPLLRFITAMASQAAVALHNFQLIEAQKQLLDAIVRLLAGAIDAKSSHTGAHCERVPELGIMLADVAAEVQQGPLADFHFKSEDEKTEFRIGAWLHDCGKLTTPEAVVNKASKLETLYNRIHEIRTRFEVMRRDARIEQLEAVAAGADADAEQLRFEERCRRLEDDFSFVAECNIGSESMAPEKISRLQQIAQQTWRRYFDDRLGLAYEEFLRHRGHPGKLPVLEPLLADKPYHVVTRSDTRTLDPQWGFRIDVPKHQNNFGELYNLCVPRGTLNNEERFQINEHVMQTLIMLKELPLPKTMRNIPEYAATHHETLIGNGYPRKLTAAELTVPMRIMAIADIFEALTAADRPYKKAKTLSEAIHILAGFKRRQHIDSDLFDLFLTSGVYLTYAEKYLSPEQIDEVDIDRYIGPLAEAAQKTDAADADADVDADADADADAAKDATAAPPG